MLRTRGMAIVFFALILALLLPTAPAALALTNGTADGMYDFGGLSPTSNSAEAGYQALGDKFKTVNGEFLTDVDATYIYKSSATPATIYAVGNAACKSFTFKDMGFSAYQVDNNFTSLHLVLKDNLNHVLSDENLGASQNIPLSGFVQLSSLYPSHGTWNVPGVSTIEITCTTAQYDITFINFENITLSGIINKYLNAQTPAITVQPAGKTVNVGESASLSVVAGGVSVGTLSYQWYSNTVNQNSGGTPAPGAAQSAAYSAPTGTLGTTYYYCVVTNTDTNAVNNAKTAASATAAVTVNNLTNAQAPVITQQPQDASVLTGSPASLSVMANVSSGTLSYQWYSNTINSNLGGALVSGATSSTCAITPSAAGTVWYYCEITNTDNSATGSKTTSTVSSTAAVTASYGAGTFDFSGLGANDSAGAGNAQIGDLLKAPNGMYAAIRSLSADSGPYTALYVYSASTATAILEAQGNATCRSFTFKDLGFSAFQDVNTFTSLTLTLKDNLGSVLYTQDLGASGTIPKDSVVMLSSLYSRAPWNVAGVSRIEISFTLSAHDRTFLAFENIALSNVSSKYLNALTPAILAQPSDKSVNVGEAASLSVTAGSVSAGTISYQWYSNSLDQNTGGSLIPGAQSPTYSASTNALGTTYYYCVVTNTDANAINGTKTVVSDAALVNVNDLVNAQAPVISAQPQGKSVKTGNAATLTVTASVTSGTLGYQWYSNSANNNLSGALIPGATSTTYAVTPTTVGTVWYYCVVTNTDNSATGSKTTSTASDTAAVIASYGVGVYDFSGLAADDSVGIGYVRIGSLLKAPTNMYSAAGSLNIGSNPLTALYFKSPSITTAVFEAEDVATCESFTFKDLGLSAYQTISTFSSLRLVLKDSSGGVLYDQTFGASGAIPKDSVVQLSAVYSRSPWNVAGVSKIELTYDLDPNTNDYLTFENISLLDVVAPITATEITSAGAGNITAPAAGAAPAGAASLTAGDASYTVTGLAWQNTNGSAATLVNGNFKAGTSYKAVIELTAAVGYKFPAAGLTPSVNAGTPGAGTVNMDAEGNKLTFTVTFGATQPLSVLGIGVKMQPGDLEYVQGQALDLSGLVVTLLYNDTSMEDVLPAQFALKNITAVPANGTILTVASHNGQPITLSCNAYSLQTSALLVEDATYTITSDKATLDFSSSIEGYAAAPAAQTVTIQNTGNSTVALTLPASTQYDFGALSATSLAAGESATFTVRPKTGLAAGGHNELITVTTDHLTAASINASFTVQAADYAVSASPLTLNFGSAIEGYAAAPAAQTVTIQNDGNSTVTLSLPASTQYDFGTLSATSLAAGESATFTVRPKTGLAAGGHNELITVTTDHLTAASINASFTVQAADYAVSASPLTLNFGSAIEGYAAAPAAQTVTIQNDGNSTVALSLPASTQYDFGALSKLSLAAGESATFTVRPKTGLAAGNHAETITVTTDHATSASVSAAFTVQSADYAISLTPLILNFGSLIEEYATAPAPQTVTIQNYGNSTVTPTLPISPQYDFGALSKLSLAAGESATFTVRPKAGLAAGNHAETITVTTDHATSASVSAAFTVQAASYSISADPFLITFASAAQGAAPPAAKTVTITNTGNVAVTLTQPTATNYTVSTISALQLEPLETAVFDVQPKPGLAEGAYDETIAVPGSNGASAQVAVHFTVTAALSYAIEASPALITFDSLAEGYLPPEAKTVTVTNTGNQNVSLYQPTAAHYVIGALSGTALIPGGSAEFTVVPKPGLAQGAWDETILILGSNGAQAQAEIAFTCTAPLPYQIISGDTSFEQGGSDDTTLTITGNGSIQDFTGLTLNGEVVDRSDYDLRSGSTIITLHHDFLAGLAPGEYTLRILYTDGYAQARFTVYDKMPVTGDNDAVAIYGILLALSLAILVALSRKRRTAK